MSEIFILLDLIELQIEKRATFLKNETMLTHNSNIEAQHPTLDSQWHGGPQYHVEAQCSVESQYFD